MTLRKELIEILACPQCKGKIEIRETGKVLICTACELFYEIRGGIPVMLIPRTAMKEK